MDPISPSAVRDLMGRHQFRIKKKWGQNFLTDGNIINKILETAEININDTVVEIGPGLGVLTRRLAQKAQRVIAVEIDRSVFPVLEETLAGFDNVALVENDALKTNFDRLVSTHFEGHTDKYKVVANLPYYITSPLIMHLLEERFSVSKIIIMVQDEVACRLTASPGTKEYGALTIAANYYAEVQTAFKVPRTVFMPRPEVDSAVVSLIVRNVPNPSVINEADYFTIVRAAFQQRRKTLLNALSGVEKQVPKEKWLSILQQADIDPVRRGETLSLHEFARLADIYTKFK